ncbi:MAG: phosphotransferase [Acidimicrobiales bacterium]|nr:phosphotransferase [Acidimicrobiales bacterium]
MTVKSDTPALIGSRLAEAWPGTVLATEPTPLTGGFWASMYRLRLEGQPVAVPSDVVFRIAPDAAMGAKELAVQETVADMGFSTPHVRLSRPADDDLGGTWSVMDFAVGTPPLGDLNGIAALRRAPRLFTQLPAQLAVAMTGLHTIDPEPVTAAVKAAAPTVAWTVEDLFGYFEAGAEVVGRDDLVAAVRALADCRPPEGTTVICHGDLHPFNLLVETTGDVVLIDWTAAIRADPAYDVAFTTMLVANPPLDAPSPLAAVIAWVGARLARRFVARYLAITPQCDLRALDWYRALHGVRILVEVASLEGRRGPGSGGHPFEALVPAAGSAVRAVTGESIATQA